MVELLCAVLSGGSCSTEVRSMFKNFTANGDNAHFFVVIDPGHFGDRQSIAERTNRILADIAATALPGSAVRIPGHSRSANLKSASIGGIELEQKSKDSLVECARNFEMELPAWLQD